MEFHGLYKQRARAKKAAVAEQSTAVRILVLDGAYKGQVAFGVLHHPQDSEKLPCIDAGLLYERA
jgi:hypothetical protein